MLSTRYVPSDVHRPELTPLLASSERSAPLPTDRARRAQVVIALRAQRLALGHNWRSQADHSRNCLGGTQRKLSIEGSYVDPDFPVFFIPPQCGPLFNLAASMGLSDFLAFLGSRQKLMTETVQKQTPAQKSGDEESVLVVRIFFKALSKELKYRLAMISINYYNCQRQTRRLNLVINTGGGAYAQYVC